MRAANANATVFRDAAERRWSRSAPAAGGCCVPTQLSGASPRGILNRVQPPANGPRDSLHTSLVSCDLLSSLISCHRSCRVHRLRRQVRVSMERPGLPSHGAVAHTAATYRLLPRSVTGDRTRGLSIRTACSAHVPLTLLTCRVRSAVGVGLGWMIPKTIWSELRERWPSAPTTGWDHWMRLSSTAKGRE
jgi:hypothetical protein